MAKEAVDATQGAARLKALQATIDKIEKDYGKGTIMKLGDQPEWDASQVIPSGSIALDHALGIGGYPKGRIIEIYGPGRAPVRPRLPSTPSPRPRRTAVSPPSSTPSMPSTASMPSRWVWT